MLEQPFVQALEVTWQRIGEHVESSTQRQGLIGQVDAENSLAHF